MSTFVGAGVSIFDGDGAEAGDADVDGLYVGDEELGL